MSDFEDFGLSADELARLRAAEQRLTPKPVRPAPQALSLPARIISKLKAAA